MGYKNIKEHFNIGHIVQIIDNRICIGSRYIGEIISISFEGKLIKKYDRSNDYLCRYQKEFEIAEKSGLLKELIDKPDTFTNLKEIYTYENGRVLKKYCEKYGWPNVCTDGDLIYENTFWSSKKMAIKACKNDAFLGLKFALKNEKSRIKESFQSIGTSFKYFFAELFYYLISKFQ